MMDCQFQVGQDVVCINNDRLNLRGEFELAVGGIYKIRWIGPYTHPFFDDWPPGDICLRLFGVREDCAVPFHHSRFRPVKTKNTDISVFKALLNPTKTKELERA